MGLESDCTERLKIVVIGDEETLVLGQVLATHPFLAFVVYLFLESVVVLPHEDLDVRLVYFVCDAPLVKLSHQEPCAVHKIEHGALVNWQVILFFFFKFIEVN